MLSREEAAHRGSVQRLGYLPLLLFFPKVFLKVSLGALEVLPHGEFRQSGISQFERLYDLFMFHECCFALTRDGRKNPSDAIHQQAEVGPHVDEVGILCGFGDEPVKMNVQIEEKLCVFLVFGLLK